MLRRALVTCLVASLCAVGLAGTASAQSYPPGPPPEVEEPPPVVTEPGPEVGGIGEEVAPDDTASTGSGLLPRTGIGSFESLVRFAMLLFVAAAGLLVASRRREHLLRA